MDCRLSKISSFNTKNWLKQFSVANSSKSLSLLFFSSYFGGLLLDSVAILVKLNELNQNLNKPLEMFLLSKEAVTCFLSIAKTLVSE